MIQATDKQSIRSAVSQFGPAPGALFLLNLEKEAAEQAIQTGLYIVWRHPNSQQDCTRVGPNSKCFCGHLFQNHNISKRTNPCTSCHCNRYRFIPQRPEEVGEWWLPRRKEFDIRTYRVKCRCRHTHEEHDPRTESCRMCSCFRFESNFLCLVCDKHWEEHETLYEDESERRMAGRTTGGDFMPLARDQDIQQMVFASRGRGRYVKKRPRK